MGIMLIADIGIGIAKTAALNDPFGNNLQCYIDDLKGFNEEDLESEWADIFDAYDCCFLDGDMEAFWANIYWKRSSHRGNDSNYANIPVQCCRDTQFPIEDIESYFRKINIKNCLYGDLSERNKEVCSESTRYKKKHDKVVEYGRHERGVGRVH